MTEDDVDLRLVDTNARIPTFLQTDDAVLLGFSTGDLVRVQAEEPEASYRSFAEYGINSYGTGAIVSEGFMKDNPDAVEAFVEASRKGWEDAMEDPSAAVEASVKLFADIDEDLVSKGLEVAIDTLLHTEATADLPLGVTANSDWTEMLELQRDYADFSGSVEPTDYYTSEFNK